MTDTPELTESQKKFLEECEEKFAKRYTEDDEDFMAIHSKDPQPPPIIVPWNRMRQNNRRRDWRNDSSGNSRDWDNGNRDRHGRGRTQHYQDNRYQPYYRNDGVRHLDNRRPW